MPAIPDSDDVLQPQNFSKGANPDSIPGVQASESYKLDAERGAVLGKKGETVGFAKYQFDGDQYNALVAEKNIHKLTESMTRLRNGLANILQEMNQAPAADLPGLARRLGEKCDETIGELKVKGRLTQEELNGLGAMTPQQIHDMVDGKLAVAGQRLAEINPAIEAMAKVAGPAGFLAPANGQMPPDSALLARSVAAYQVDQLLGTGMIAEEKFATDDLGVPMGVSIQADGAGITGKHEDVDKFLKVELDDADIQRGLADLEAVDYITGQIDRHCGNIFIDPNTKKVTGIDNDLGFPEKSRQAMFAEGGDFKGKAVTGMPRQMHAATAEKIMATDPEQLRQMLQNMPTPDGVGRMGQPAIDECVVRLQELQAAIQNPPPGFKVVSEFNDQTYEEAVAAQNAIMPQLEREDGTMCTVTLDNITKLDLNPTEETNVAGCPKSSYLGSALVQKARYQMGMDLEPAKWGERLPNTTSKAQRNEQYAAQHEMTKESIHEAKQILAANPSQAATPAIGQELKSLQRDIAAQKEKIAGYEKRIDQLDSHKAGAMLRSLRFLGPSGAKDAFAEKLEAAKIDLARLETRLDTKLDQALSSEVKADLKHAAEVNVSNRAQFRPHAPSVHEALAAQNNLHASGHQPNLQQSQGNLQAGGQNAPVPVVHVGDQLHAQPAKSAGIKKLVELGVQPPAPPHQNVQAALLVDQKQLTKGQAAIAKLKEMGIQPPAPPAQNKKSAPKQGGFN